MTSVDRLQSGSRRPWFALLGTLLAVLVFDHLRIFPYLRTASFHMDSWEMVARAYDPRGMLASQLEEVRHWIRIRPVFQLSVPVWVKLRGINGPDLAVVLWGVVLIVQGLAIRFLRILGLALPAAVLASFLVLLSCGVVRTTYAHQYNDVTFSHFFTLLMLMAALRWQSTRALLVTLPLLALSVLSHESGVMGATLLVICDGFTEGPRTALQRLRTPSRLVPFVLCVVYAGLRFALTPPTTQTLSGFQAVSKNIGYLLSYASRELFIDLRGPLLVGFAIVVFRTGGPPLRAFAIKLAFALAWLVAAYLPFLTNQNYQSTTYLNLALLLPAAVWVEPAAAWAFDAARTRGQQLFWPAVMVLGLNHWTIAEDLSEFGRFVGPTLKTVMAHLPADQKPLDIWLVEDEDNGKSWGRTKIQDDLLMYRPDESIAFNLTVTDRDVHVHPIDDEAIRFARPRADDLVLRMMTGPRDNASLWLLPIDGGPPTLVHASGSEGLAQPEPLHQAPLPTGADGEIVARLWADHGSRQLAKNAVRTASAQWQGVAETRPAWWRALQALSPELPVPPNGIPVEPRRIRVR